MIDRGDMDRLADRVREVMTTWREPGRTFGAEGMDAVAQALGYRVQVRAPLHVAFDREDRRVIELTDAQAYARAFVLHRRRAAVMGPAGGGKTILATEVAEHLSLSGKRTLLTCFTESLGEQLRTATDGTPILQAIHFHGLCVQIAREAGIDAERPADIDELTWLRHTLPEALARGARTLGPRFDAIVVDQAQDFEAQWWPALLALHTDPDEGPLYLFADDAEPLGGGGALPVSPADVVPLPQSLRGTTPIREFVSVFHGTGGAEGDGAEGRPVEILDYRDEAELIRLVEVVLTNLIEEEGVPLQDIVVLTPGDIVESRLWARRTIGRFTLTDRPQPDAVLWSSVGAFQGSERPVVILAELETGNTEDELRRSVYAGGSRARSHLIVIASPQVARTLRAEAFGRR